MRLPLRQTLVFLGSLLVVLAAWPLDPARLSPEALALTQGGQQSSSPNQVPRGRKARRKFAPAVAPPAVVRDVRLKTYPDHTRLVLDMQHSTSFTQNRLAQPNRIIIELQNTQMANPVKDRVAERTWPGEITLTQPHPRSVVISLDMQTIRDYKLMPLSKPDRLVVDVYPATPAPSSAPIPRTPSAPAVVPAAVPSPVKQTKPALALPVNTLPSDSAPVLAKTALPPAPQPPTPSQPTAPHAMPPAARTDIKMLVIDAGHGGRDPGAVGRSGTAEKDITLNVALRLRDLISKRLGKDVLLTRDKDVFLELEDRAKFANKMGADLFVSIHVNAHPQRSTRGVEIYHFGEASDRRALEVAARENGTPIKDTGIGWQYLVADLLTTKKVQESLELAWTTKKAMVARLDDYYDVADHGVKTAPFYVLRFTTMPSILAEIAFITNPTEERLMQSDAFLHRMAEAIFDGVKAYVKLRDTTSR